MAIETIFSNASLVGPDPKVIAPLLIALFRQFDDEGIIWAVLRDAERLPEYTRRDVDILVAITSFRRAREIVYECASANGWSCLAEFKHQYYHAHWLIKPHGVDSAFLPVELFTNQAYRGTPLLATDYGLSQRRRINEYVWAVPTGFAAATALIKELVPHQTLKEGSRELVITGARTEADLFRQSLQASVQDADLTEKLYNACLSAQWDMLTPLSRSVRSAVRGMFLRSLFGRTRYFFRAIVTRLHPPLSCFIAILGPDGSGKTTVADLVAARAMHRPFVTIHRCKNNFGMVPRMHDILYRLARALRIKMPKPTETKPGELHAGMQKPLGALRAMAQIAYYSAGLFLGHLKLPSWRAVVGLIISDRYYYDYYYMRGYDRVPHWYLRLLGVLVPKPDLIFYLDRDAEGIYQQKPELTPDEIRRQQQCIRKLLADNSRARIIDASLGADKTAEAVVECIYDYLLRKGKRAT